MQLPEKGPRTTKGKTWEEIYGPEYAAIKREQLRALGLKPKSEETKRRLSAAHKKGYAEGRKPTFLGRKHSTETKKKISEIRREKYGSTASLNQRIRYTSQYKEWRAEVLQRDNFTCQECGFNCKIAKKRIKLHVHHIVPMWKLLLNEVSFEEAIDKDHVIWNKENASTLCVPCHVSIPIGWTAKETT